MFPRWAGTRSRVIADTRLIQIGYSFSVTSNPWEQRLGVWWIAEDRPDQPAILECPAGEQLTYGELAERAHRVLHALRSQGMSAGDIVAYALPNDLDIVIWQLATSEGGLRSLALNPTLLADEMRSIADHSGAAVLVLHARYADRAADLADASSVRVRIAVGGSIVGYLDQDAFLAGQPTAIPGDRVAGDMLAYSSGTTGKPKGVWRDQPRIDPSVMADMMKSFGQAFQFRPFDGVHLVTAGMHHGGCQGFYLGALNVGQGVVIHDHFDAETMLGAIDRLSSDNDVHGADSVCPPASTAQGDEDPSTTCPASR